MRDGGGNIWSNVSNFGLTKGLKQDFNDVQNILSRYRHAQVGQSIVGWVYSFYPS